MAQYPSDNDPAGGVPPSQPRPAVWPPPPTNAPYYGQPDEGVNTSGMKTTVPPEIAALKWNWGAALMTWLWCISHKMVALGIGLFVLSLIPYLGGLVGLGATIYFGLNGHKLGWQNRRFEGGVPQFLAVQTAWLNWGVGLFVVGMVLGLIGGILGAFTHHTVMP